jgi:nitrate reductase cytochrome c-type subunit
MKAMTATLVLVVVLLGGVVAQLAGVRGAQMAQERRLEAAEQAVAEARAEAAALARALQDADAARLRLFHEIGQLRMRVELNRQAARAWDRVLSAAVSGR